MIGVFSGVSLLVRPVEWVYSNVEGPEFGLRNVCEGGAAGVVSRCFPCVFGAGSGCICSFFVCRTCGEKQSLCDVLVRRKYINRVRCRAIIEISRGM